MIDRGSGRAADYLGRRFRCPDCGGTHEVGVREITAGPGLLARADELLRPRRAGNGPALVLCDGPSHAAAGRELAAALRGPGLVRELVLAPADEARVSAREAYLPEILAALRGAQLLVTAGSGTVTDLGKQAAALAGVPVVAFATAASMNGYTSGVAALFRRGLKETLPVTPVQAVIMDEDVLARAPAALTRAGFADCLAKPLADADWRLSALLTGGGYCGLPGRIAAANVSRLGRLGRGIVAGDRAAVAALGELLNLGGISMLIAGRSSPASGGEHLLSHFLDMSRHRDGKSVFAWHGLQVGVSVVVCAGLFEALGRLDRREVTKRLAARRPGHARALRRLRELFPAAADTLAGRFREKSAALATLRANLPDHWETIRREIFPLVPGAAEAREILAAGGCPVAPAEIGVDRETARDALLLARFLRNRVTVLDLTGETGLLDEAAG